MQPNWQITSYKIFPSNDANIDLLPTIKYLGLAG